MENQKLDPEIKDLWLKALRSGSFAQGTNYLEKNDSYCCLGVLCSIAVDQGIVERAYPSSPFREISFYAEDGPDCSQVLPSEVMEWSNLEDEAGQFVISEEDLYASGISYSQRSDIVSDSFTDGTVTVTLASLNDGGVSFEKIADLIEKYL